MCWVMPPASAAATSVSRMASSSEVLPWSTWPMIVITGGRSARAASSSSYSGSGSTSSAAWTMLTFFSKESASTSIASSESVWVSVAISPRVISFLITSEDGDAQRLGHLLDGRAGLDLRRRLLLGLLGRRVEVGLDPRRAAAAAAAAAKGLLGRRRAGAPARGLGVDDHAAAAPTCAGGLLAPAATPGGAGRAVLAVLGRGLLAVGGLAAAVRGGAGAGSPAPLPAAASPAGGPSKARLTSASSTLDAAALTSKPAAWSLAMTSLEGMPRSLAIS